MFALRWPQRTSRPKARFTCYTCVFQPLDDSHSQLHGNQLMPSGKEMSWSHWASLKYTACEQNRCCFEPRAFELVSWAAINNWHCYWYSKWCEATKKSNLKPVGVPFPQEVGRTRKAMEKSENDTHKGPQEMVIGGLLPLKRVTARTSQLVKKMSLKSGWKGTLAMK